MGSYTLVLNSKNSLAKENEKVPAKLTTTVNKIQFVPNQANSTIIHEFYQYMNSTDSSVHHKNNNLKVLIAFANFLGSNVPYPNMNAIMHSRPIGPAF